ncbi:MAG: phosphoribosyl-ATP diphosphatase [Candidatus ainarchaeum sp.]|nr:phosphoribosyl-ATP diphosphatase [Candidatus ainarchaeum sp.]
MIIPSIDLMNKKLVRLVNGEKKILEIDNPKKYAQEVWFYPEIQLIDLDNALGKGNNIELIKEICNIVPCRVGGGIRTIEQAKELIESGAKKVIIGTQANKKFLSELAKNIGKEKIIVALDSKKGKVATNGWTIKTKMSPINLAKKLENYCDEFLYTSIEKDGTLSGADKKTAQKLKKITNNRIVLAGGIKSIKEIIDLEKEGIDCVSGLAIYKNKIDTKKAFIECIDFTKMNELIPTIIQENNKIISLVYSNKESLEKTIKTKKVWLYSRSKKGVFMKGATSGNEQEIIEIKKDCDNDSLLFKIKQKENGCHKGKYSCFGEKKEFSLQELYEKISDRIKNPKEGAYTSKLVKDEMLLKRKLVEEAAEVITTKNKEELIWECSDLIYFLFVIMVKEGITIKDIEKENDRRNKK